MACREHNVSRPGTLSRLERTKVLISRTLSPRAPLSDTTSALRRIRSPAKRSWLVAGGHDACGLDHENRGALRCPRSVDHTPWHGVALMAIESYGAPALKVDQQLAVEHEEELVLLIVFVPMEVALKDVESHNSIVHRGERLVEPRQKPDARFAAARDVLVAA
jgi:hypothetical protein